MTAHVPLPELALYSRGDLSLWARWRVERHVYGCDDCTRAAQEFTRMANRLSHGSTELPPQLSEAAWQALASEMTANIHLGLAAGECVSVRPRLIARPRMAFALAGLAIVAVIAGLQTSPRKPSTQHPLEDAGLRTLEASSSGIAVHSAGHILSVSAPPGIEVIQTVNTRGDMHSRYTDDTGVTINAVYADGE